MLATQSERISPDGEQKVKPQRRQTRAMLKPVGHMGGRSPAKCEMER